MVSKLEQVVQERRNISDAPGLRAVFTILSGLNVDYWSNGLDTDLDVQAWTVRARAAEVAASFTRRFGSAEVIVEHVVDNLLMGTSVRHLANHVQVCRSCARCVTIIERGALAAAEPDHALDARKDARK